jgi:Protein of unknown function (DUF4236)
MGVFRFQRHVGILPGLRFNLSKSGVSLSVGVKGAHVTVGRTPRVTVGIPGSGLSWTQTLLRGRRTPQGARQAAQPRSTGQVIVWTLALVGVPALIAIYGGGH